MASLFQLYRARLREFRREPSAFFFVLLVPLLWMLVLGFALDQKTLPPITIGLVTPSPFGDALPLGLDLDKAAAQDGAVQGSLQSPKIKILRRSLDELMVDLKRGHLNLIVDFGPSAVVYSFDSHNPEALQERLIVDRLIQQALGQMPKINSQDQTVSAYGSRYVDFLVPGLLAVSILSTSLFGVGMTIVSHRKDGLLKQLFVTPLRPSRYLVSHVLSRITILLVEGAVLLVGAAAVFQFQVAGSLWTFAGAALLGASATTALAMVMASRLTHTGAMNGLSNLVMIPVMLLSGAWFSRRVFPQWLQTFSDYLPLTPLVEALRRIALEGAGWGDIKMEALVLIAYTVLGIALSSKLFKWY